MEDSLAELGVGIGRHAGEDRLGGRRGGRGRARRGGSETRLYRFALGSDLG